MMKIIVDGREITCEDDVTVAAVMLGAGIRGFRQSVAGEPRGPLCGMGVCYECRVTIDGVAHRRSCLVTVADGMRITTVGE